MQLAVIILKLLPLPLLQVLTSQNLVMIAGQISRGMYHLAKKGHTHRDLAARNI